MLNERDNQCNDIYLKGIKYIYCVFTVKRSPLVIHYRKMLNNYRKEFYEFLENTNPKYSEFNGILEW